MARRTLLRIHSVSPDQFGAAIDARQVDLGLTVTEEVDVSGRVVIDEGDDAQAVGTKHGDHGSV